MLKKYVFVSHRQEIILKKIWASSVRPTTVILRRRNRLPRELTGNYDGLAVRLPKSKFLIKILDDIGRPLVSTSLNLSGQNNISTPKYLVDYFSKKGPLPDLVVDAGECRRRRPSRLIDLRDENNPLILRK
jgi:L-threonylcarbamoyladenylate synthase